MQSEMLVLPIGESEFAMQIEHAAEPGASLNSLAAHCVQGAPFAPVYPGSHWQFVMEVLPAGECEPEGQVVQNPLRSSEYLPAGHC